MTDRNLEVAIVGIKVALGAIAITFAVEAGAIFLPRANVPPGAIGAIYLAMGGLVLYLATRVKVPH